jgi:hypothetical protein
MHPLHHAYHGFRAGQDRPGLDQKRLARAGQFDPPFRPLEKHYTQIVFKQLNLLAQRWLRHIEISGGPTEMKLLCNSDKVAKLTQFHAAELIRRAT